VSRGGGTPPAILKNTRLTLDAEQAAAVRDRAVKAFASGKPFVAGSDWDLTMITVPPNQAQFLNTLQLTANQTAAIFGIDPREIGGSATESLTYATDESRSLNRANNMRPYLERFEAMTFRLLPNKQFVKLNVDATIRTDIKTRIGVIGDQLKDGRLSVNEARALEDRTPVPGGDFYNVPSKEGDSAARLLQQMYLAVGKIITAEEAREILKASGVSIDPTIDLDVLHANLPPQPEQQPPAGSTEGDPS
jgi:phage portal protein BeeE